MSIVKTALDIFAGRYLLLTLSEVVLLLLGSVLGIFHDWEAWRVLIGEIFQ